MPTTTVVPAQLAPFQSFPGPVARRLANRPTLTDVAGALLEQCLRKALSQRVSTPPEVEHVAMGRSVWRQENGQLTFFGYRIEGLSTMVIERFIAQAPLQAPGEGSFLTAQQGSEYPRRLSADLRLIAEEIDLAGPELVNAWCEQLLLYWQAPDARGESPLAWLAAFLRTLLGEALDASEVGSILSPAELAMARAALTAALPAAGTERSPASATVEVVPGAGQRLPSLSIKGTGAAPLWIAYSIEAGFERRDITADIATPAAPALAEEASEADPFFAWATALLASYLASRRALALQLRRARVNPQAFAAALEAFTPGWSLDSIHHLKRRQVVRDQLPAWIAQASEADRLRYALGLADVLKAERAAGGSNFLHNVPTPEAYARQRLLAQAAQDHPMAPLADVDDVVVRIFSRVDDNLLSLAGGGGSVSLQEQQISLVELSLLNTGGRPAGWLQISAREGRVLPAWLDEDGAMALVKSVDVGRRYLTLLHEALVSGKEAPRRRSTFTAVASVQVPLLALELKLQGACGFDEEGVTLVRRTFLPDATIPHPVFARLGLRAAPSLEADPVAGMFVLYQPDTSDTLVLYAPFARQPLRQFRDRASLMSAIRAESELREFVLSWLSDTAQARYRNGGLREPHWLRFGLGGDFAAIPVIAPAKAVPIPLHGNPIDGVYDGIVDALVRAADRQTVSNQESFWISAREVGWLVFNQVLPFLSGPAATAGWLIQISHGLDEHFNEVGATEAPAEPGTGELLFDLILALVSEGTSRALAGVPPRGTHGPGPDRLSHLPPLSVRAVLETRWSSPSLTLTGPLRERLQALAVKPPADLSPAVPSGPLQGLRRDGQRWLAWAENAWFVVDPAGDEAVVLNPLSGEASGPRLQRDEVGRWRLDLRLRLRGGGPKRRIEQVRELNRQRKERAGQCLREIQRLYRDARDAGIAGDKAINDARAAGNQSVLHARGLQEAARVEGVVDRCAALRVEYETIASEVFLPEYGKELSTAFTAEANLCCYYLGLNRDLLVDRLEAARTASPDLFKEAPLTSQALKAWFEFLHDYLGIAQAGARGRARLDERLTKLADIPVAGPNALATLAPKVEGFRQLIEYRALCIYAELSLIEEPLTGDHYLRNSVHEALQPLVVGLNTHKELAMNPSVAEGAGLELLDGVVNAYQAAEDTLHWLRQTLRAEYVSPAMERLAGVIPTLRLDAEASLGELIRQAPSAKQPPAPVTTPAGRERRVIRTRTRGPVIAKVRPAQGQAAVEIAEVVSPLDNQVLARFEHDATRGDWVEQPAPPAHPLMRQPTEKLEHLAAQADRQLDSASRQLQQAPRLARATRIPVELEELMGGTARNLDQLAEKIEQALTQRNETDAAVETWGSAERKARALRDMARRLIDEGRTLRVRLTKTALPTVARVRYLVQQNEASVARLGSKVALKGQGKRKDLIQEYAIQEPDGTVLWYAHFHYASIGAPDGDYIAAHLKLPSQRFMGLQTQMAQAATDAEVVKIYRSRIDPVSAQELFLSRP